MVVSTVCSELWFALFRPGAGHSLCLWEWKLCQLKQQLHLGYSGLYGQLLDTEKHEREPKVFHLQGFIFFFKLAVLLLSVALTWHSLWAIQPCRNEWLYKAWLLSVCGGQGKHEYVDEIYWKYIVVLQQKEMLWLALKRAHCPLRRSQEKLTQSLGPHIHKEPLVKRVHLTWPKQARWHEWSGRIPLIYPWKMEQNITKVHCALKTFFFFVD